MDRIRNGIQNVYDQITIKLTMSYEVREAELTFPGITLYKGDNDKIEGNQNH